MRIERRPVRRRLPWGGVLCLLLFGAVACDQTEKQTVQTPPPDQIEQPPRPDIKYSGAEGFRVRLDAPLVRPDASGTPRSWDEAFVVRLRVSRPPSPGPAFEVFLDGDSVGEYGGWKEGIYFWVFDPREMDGLDGRALSYRFAGGDLVELGALSLGDPDSFNRIHEKELRAR